MERNRKGSGRVHVSPTFNMDALDPANFDSEIISRMKADEESRKRNLIIERKKELKLRLRQTEFLFGSTERLALILIVLEPLVGDLQHLIKKLYLQECLNHFIDCIKQTEMVIHLESVPSLVGDHNRDQNRIRLSITANQGIELNAGKVGRFRATHADLTEHGVKSSTFHSYWNDYEFLKTLTRSEWDIQRKIRYGTQKYIKTGKSYIKTSIRSTFSYVIWVMLMGLKCIGILVVMILITLIFNLLK